MSAAHPETAGPHTCDCENPKGFLCQYPNCKTWDPAGNCLPPKTLRGTFPPSGTFPPGPVPLLPPNGTAVEGKKNDDDKTRLDLIPPEAIAALGKVLTFGAQKYAPRNWERGMRWGRIFAACLRHLYAYWAREERDPETGMSHLWHAFCCIAFLIAYEERKIGEDDRPMPRK